MEENFVTFISKFKPSNENINTNVTYQNPTTPASYLVPANYYKVFVDRIADELFGKTGHIVIDPRYSEQGQKNKKFIMDFDFLTDRDTFLKISGNYDRVFNDNNIKYIVIVINKLLRDFFPDGTVDGLEIFIMKRHSIAKDVKGTTNIKDGLHLAIPELICTSDFLMHFRKKFIAKLFRNSDSPFYPARELAEQIVDKAILGRTPWMFYGCSKTGDNPYLINYSYIFRDLETKIPHNKNTAKSFVSRFSMLYIDDRHLTKYTESFDITEIECVFQVQKPGLKIIPGTGKQYTQEELQYYWRILDALTKPYYTDYTEWRNVGFILASISKQSDQMYELWIKFSKKSDSQFNYESADNVWTAVRQGFWDETHLLGRLKKSNAILYDEIINQDLKKKILLHNTKWGHDDIAAVLYLFAKDRFKMCSAKHNDKQIYEFVNHVWKFRKNSVSLNMCLKIDIKKLFVDVYGTLQKAKRDYYDDDLDESSESERKIKDETKKIKNIEGALADFKDDKKKKHIIDAAFDWFNDYEFLDNINRHTHLFAFKNGVLDCWTGIFGPGNPDDYITQQCPHDYFELDPSKENYEFLKGIFSQIDEFYASIFPSPELAAFVKKIHAKCLMKTTNDARTWLNYGGGSNGKTKMTTLIQMGFGSDYYTEIDVGLFTQNRKKTGDTNSEKAKLKNKNIGYTSEIGKREVLSMAAVKEITGGGMVTGGRDIFVTATEGTFKATCCLFWQVNYKPKIDCDLDDGVVRRLRVINYEVKFVREDDPRVKNNPKYFKPMDELIDIKIENWSKYYCSYLAHILKTEILNKGPVIEPECVMKATNDYLASINMLERFKIDCFIEAELHEKITHDQIWYHFLKWQKESQFTEKISKDELLEYMRGRFEKHINGHYFEGLKIKE